MYTNFNPLNANPTKWPNTLKKLPTNCLSVFDHFVKLALKGLTSNSSLHEPFTLTLREKCPNMEIFLVRIFPHSD